MAYRLPSYGLNPFRNAYEMYSANWHNVKQFFGDISGYNQYRNTVNSTQTQIAYNDYIKQANERAQADWYRNVGGRRSIAYPELSYAGAIYRADTGTARAMYDADTAYSNFAGNIPFRSAGLYGIVSRANKWL